MDESATGGTENEAQLRAGQSHQLIAAARRREIDVALVWRLDRWGRSLLDLVTTLQELNDLNIGFVSLSEALDLTTSTGRAMAGMLSVFAAFEQDILRERVRAGLDHARQSGTRLGRAATAAVKAAESPETVPPGNQQIRDLPASGNRQNLRPPHIS